MALTREEVLHVAKLARIGLTDEDVVKFQGQLSQILEHFEVLNAIPTEGIEPTTYTLSLEGVAAADEPAPSGTWHTRVGADFPPSRAAPFGVR